MTIFAIQHIEKNKSYVYQHLRKTKVGKQCKKNYFNFLWNFDVYSLRQLLKDK